MTISNKAISIGAALAMSAASMIGTTTTAIAAEQGASATVHCYGVNKCKGHNDCKTADNACKGHSACKGHGFVSMSAKACDDIGGTTKKGG